MINYNIVQCPLNINYINNTHCVIIDVYIADYFLNELFSEPSVGLFICIYYVLKFALITCYFKDCIETS